MSSTAIKISSELAESARQAAEAAHRSLTGQIEHWATIGRNMEPNLTGSVTQKIKKSSDLSLLDAAEREQILQIFEFLRMPTVGASVSIAAPFPLYEADPEDSTFLVQVNANGTRTRGKMINRQFIPA